MPAVVAYIVRVIGLSLAIMSSGAYTLASPFAPTGIVGSAVSAMICAACVMSWPRIPGEWRRDPPTERQLKYAESLGIVVPPGFTKGQVSELISAAVDRADG